MLDLTNPSPASSRSKEAGWIELVCVAFHGDPRPIAEVMSGLLDAGTVEPDELLEFTLHYAVYNGWPRAAIVDGVLRALRERRGPETSAPTGGGDGASGWFGDIEEGAAAFRAINLQPSPAPDTPFAEAILRFVFGVVWRRTRLPVRERRLIAIVSCALAGTAHALDAHLRAALESGDLTPDALADVVSSLRTHATAGAARLLEERLGDAPPERSRRPDTEGGTNAAYLAGEVDVTTDARLRSISQASDEHTTRHLEAVGVLDGARCADVGAGAGTIAVWLSERVGPHGHVVATDIDTRWLRTIDRPNLTVVEHDVEAGPVPPGDFDVLSVRAVLQNVDARLAIDNMVVSLRPGGMLAIEETDLGVASLMFPAGHPLARFWEAAACAITAAGGNPFVGRQIPQLLLGAGLTDVHVSGEWFTPWTDDAYEASVARFGPVLVEAGLLDPEDLAAVAALPRGRDSLVCGLLRVTVSGRKPIR